MSAESGPLPLGEDAPESLFLFLDPAAGRERRRELWRRLASLLPRLSWRSHVYLLGESPGEGLDAALEAARLAGAFLGECAFATLHLHPLLRLKAFDEGARDGWARFCDRGRSFQDEAYEEQSESRLFLSPLLLPHPELRAAELRAAIDFLDSRLAVPSVYLSPGADRNGADLPEPVRVYLGRGGVPGLAGRLLANHVFESVLAEVERRGSDLLRPCSPHLVLDEGSDRSFSCLRRHQSNDPSPGAPVEQCPDCIGESVLSMGAELAANGRRSEGGRACFELASVCTAHGRHGQAADLARCAAGLAAAGEGRAAALIQQGLAHLELGELEAAEEALGQAAGYSADQAFVAYHRGRVQFAWRDYIEALDRFQEALDRGSPRVAAADIHFQMATCHINLEEYPEARAHLERSLPPGERAATVSFYRGVCELGEGRARPALNLFREALEIGPSAEDRGRVLFYIGTCLKEEGRLDEALEALREAVEADPEDLANHNLLGFCYYKLRRHEEAVRCFRRAVEIDPGSAMDWANLGSNLRDLGRREEAIAMYEKALALDPFIGFARAGLAKLKETS